MRSGVAPRDPEAFTQQGRRTAMGVEYGIFTLEYSSS
ncbi:hypothetical protein FHX15_002772 [Rhizobium sp. BK650]|nr:hypothetical protein [Rhizobium sp. BK650]